MLKRITSLVLFLTYFISNACLCNGKTFENEVKKADEIFIGRLIEIKEIDTKTYDYEFEETDQKVKTTRFWYAKFEVEKKWKGSNKKYIEIYQEAGNCSFKFNISVNSYLVYARTSKEPFELNGKKVLYTSGCFRTKEFYYNLKSKNGEKNQPNKDFYLLNKKFPNTIELVDNTPFHWKLPLLGVLIFITGLFIGKKIK